MSGYEILDLMAENRGTIYDTWYFFLTVHMAIFGIVYIASTYTHFLERLILAGAYGGFLFVNFRAQDDNYTLQTKLVAAIQDLEGAPVAQAIVSGDNSMWIIEFLPVLYGCVAAVSVLIILFINRGRAD